MEKKQNLRPFYLVSNSFLPPSEKGDTKAFNEGQKGHCFVAKEVQDYELCIKPETHKGFKRVTRVQCS